MDSNCSNEDAQVIQGMEGVVEWLWVAGYSSLSTLVIIFNSLIFFSVGKNSYLHYSTHYTVLALALRNIIYMLLSICILLLTKLEENPWILKDTLLHTPKSSELLCEIMSCLDTFLSSLMMFYLLGLAGYMFCRSPNPPISHTSQTTLKMYGLNSKAMHIQEGAWQAPLLLLLPLLCAVLICLPIPLLHMPHPLSAIPDKQVCTTKQPNINYQTSVATLAYCLPIITLVLLIIGLSIRRCLSCTGGECISSFCKEEIFLGMITFPYSLVSVAKLLPLLDTHLERIGMATTGFEDYLNPAVTRAVEGGCGMFLPILLYCLLPPYRRFTSQPDSSDLYQSKRDIYRQSLSTGERLSQASEDMI